MVLDVKKLEKKYHGNKALDDISFSVKKNDIFGLLGKSGAGKTTTIKILTSQIKRDGGVVSIFNKDIDNWNRKDNTRLGIMTDDFGVYERLTCLENLKLFEKIYDISSDSAVEALKKVGLDEAYNKKVYELSKGMKQRLCLAKAILHRPELLFLDEPTSDLDPSTTEKIHGILRNLNASGTTIFLTTHDMDEAYKLCDNIGIINNGKMIAYGKPNDLCYKYDFLRTVKIVDKNKQEHVFNNIPQNAKYIANYFENDDVLSIRSSEPDLEQLFIKLVEESEQKSEQCDDL
ncbi:MAG: ABC transporter ATP-binding protein [Butyrivibrio sp.]|nr:ABC transporter ATP-binding protein [Butyrivibrio sp.]MBQ7431711.1 ABC transporter ATP-binding protein [Butyrivibrio sp.]